MSAARTLYLYRREREKESSPGFIYTFFFANGTALKSRKKAPFSPSIFYPVFIRV